MSRAFYFLSGCCCGTGWNSTSCCSVVVMYLLHVFVRACAFQRARFPACVRFSVHVFQRGRLRLCASDAYMYTRTRAHAYNATRSPGTHSLLYLLMCPTPVTIHRGLVHCTVFLYLVQMSIFAIFLVSRGHREGGWLSRLTRRIIWWILTEKISPHSCLVVQTTVMPLQVV